MKGGANERNHLLHMRRTDSAEDGEQRAASERRALLRTLQYNASYTRKNTRKHAPEGVGGFEGGRGRP